VRVELDSDGRALTEGDATVTISTGGSAVFVPSTDALIGAATATDDGRAARSAGTGLRAMRSRDGFACAEAHGDSASASAPTFA
jgi:hypothetical protein